MARPLAGSVRRQSVSPPTLANGSSDAPAVRSWISAWRTRSAAMRKSGLPASASSIRLSSWRDEKLRHQPAPGCIATAGTGSDQPGGIVSPGCVAGSVIAQPVTSSATAARSKVRRWRRPAWDELPRGAGKEDEGIENVILRRARRPGRGGPPCVPAGSRRRGRLRRRSRTRAAPAEPSRRSACRRLR